MLRGPLPGLAGTPVLGLGPLDPGAQAPGPAAAGVVVEQSQRILDGEPRLRGPGARLGVQAHELALDPCSGLRAWIARALDRFVQHAPGVLEPPGLEQRDPEREQQRLVAGPQRRRALEQSGGAGRVAPPQGPARRAPQPLRRLLRERIVGREPELAPVAPRALEVEAEQLVLRVGLGLQPLGELLVQLGAPALGHAVVGDLADQRVREAEAILARVLGPLGMDELVARQRRQRRGQGVAAHQGRERAAMEAAPLDGGVLEQRALGHVEEVEARRQHRLDRRRQLAWPVRRHADRHQLLEEQRVALGAVDHAPRRDAPRAQLGDQRQRVDLAERVEAEDRRAALRRRPRRPALEHLGRPRHTSTIGAPVEKATT